MINRLMVAITLTVASTMYAQESVTVTPTTLPTEDVPPVTLSVLSDNVTAAPGIPVIAYPDDDPPAGERVQ